MERTSLIRSLINGGLILESSIKNRLIDAINQQKVCVITYTKNGATQKREIEPISIGRNSSGNTVLRAWQLDGNSESFDTGNWKKNDPLTKIQGYRMFNIDYIETLEVTDEPFRTDPAFLKRYRPKHNKMNGWEDKDMNYIDASVILDKGETLESIFDELLDKVLKNPSIPLKDKDMLKNSDVADFRKGIRNINSWLKTSSKKTKQIRIMQYFANILGKELKNTNF